MRISDVTIARGSNTGAEGAGGSEGGGGGRHEAGRWRRENQGLRSSRP